MQIRGRIDAKQVIDTLDRRFLAALARNRRIMLEKAAAHVIATARRGDWFTNETGKLKSQLQASRARVTKTDGDIDVMWTGPSAVYGPVLEHGPKVKRWEIKPRGKTAEGKPVKALRWVGKQGGVHYARKVVHIDKPEHRRKHIEPSMRTSEPAIERMQLDAIARAKYAVGLR